MRSLFPFIIVGITTGAVYALASMGLVLTYTTSGVFNFAHGAVGMAATYVFYSLRVDAGWPTALAAAVAVLGVGPAMGVVIDRLLLRRLVGAPSSTYVVVSLGLLVALQGFFLAVYGAAPRRVEVREQTLLERAGAVRQARPLRGGEADGGQVAEAAAPEALAGS